MQDTCVRPSAVVNESVQGFAEWGKVGGVAQVKGWWRKSGPVGGEADGGGGAWMPPLCQIQTPIPRPRGPNLGCCRLLSLVPAKQQV